MLRNRWVLGSGIGNTQIARREMDSVMILGGQDTSFIYGGPLEADTGHNVEQQQYIQRNTVVSNHDRHDTARVTPKECG